MREIEIKAAVKDVAALHEKLVALGVELTKPIRQHDRVFGEPRGIENAFDANWLRIRTENDKKHIFTLKRSVVGHLDSIEHETVVEDAYALEEIIRAMGYTPYSDLTKIRQKGRYEDIELCYDELPGLGSFVQAELMMGEGADHDEIVKKLWDLLRRLGIDKKDEVHEGYDVLERRQRGI